MKRNLLNQSQASLRIVMTGALCLFLGFAGSAMSQSAEIFTPGTGDAASSTNNGVQKKLPEPGPVDSQPSRFAGQDIEPYIAARAAVFSMRNRATDPFGLFQDPDAKPAIRRVVNTAPGKHNSALPPTPLSDIIKLIRVTTIMPGEKQFLVGTRSFSEGDEFPLIFESKTLSMKVIEVTPRRILLRNLDNGEDAALETGMLPPGMIAGANDMRPDGMVMPGETVPLKLESSRY